MSSPKAAKTKVTKTGVAADQPTRVIKAPPQGSSAPIGVEKELSAEARRLAGALEQALAAGERTALSPQALQALMAQLCRLYAAQVEGGSDATPVAEGQTVSPTALMVSAGGLLRAGNLAVFELGMWQSWTGR